MDNKERHLKTLARLRKMVEAKARAMYAKLATKKKV